MASRACWILALFVLSGAAICGPAGAVTHSVRPDGSGDYPTIQEAVDHAGPGDVIALTDGVFTGPGNRDIVIDGIDLAVISESGEADQVIIDCEGREADPHRGFTLRQLGTSSLLMAITIRNGYGSGDGAGIVCEDASTTIVHCVLEDNYAASQGAGIYGEGPGAPTVDHCRFVDNWVGDGGRGGAIYLTDECDLEAVYCTFEANGAEQGAGMFADAACAIEIENCTFSGQQGPALHVGNGSQTLAEKCIIALGSDEAVICAATGSAAFSCSDIFGNAGGDWTGCIAGQELADGNLTVDPLFCDAAGGDFTLHANSPCLPEFSGGCALIGAWDAGCGVMTYTLRADGQGDYSTIQAALDQAAAGSILELIDGTYAGEGNRDLDLHGKDFTIRSASGDAQACILDCQGTLEEHHRGFNLTQPVTSTCLIENLTITGACIDSLADRGYGGGVYCGEGVEATIRGCIFHDNLANWGAGILCDSASAPRIEGCTFTHNETDWGGGVGVFEGQAFISGCDFEDNYGGDGGMGIMVSWGTAEIRDCRFLSNWFDSGGGLGAGLRLETTTAPVTVENCEFAENSGWHGAGICLLYSDAVLSGCQFVDNATHTTGSNGGGAIYSRYEGNLTLIDCDFSGNQSNRGGAIHKWYGSMVMENCTFDSNDTDGGESQHGGAIYVRDAELDLVACEFRGNASETGGAIHIEGSLPVGAEDCGFIANSADEGGALHCVGVSPEITGCRFERNSAAFGGGIAGESGGGAIHLCTFWDNTAQSGGGAIGWGGGGGPMVISCTLDENAAEGGGGAGIAIADIASLNVAQTIISRSTAGPAVSCAGGAMQLSCSDIYQNAGGDWIGCIASQFGQSGNICADPLYCGDLHPEAPHMLQEDSPCAEENNPECGQIGAWGVGCPPAAGVEGEERAGRVKLHPIRPNPISGDVVIVFRIADAGSDDPAELAVFDAAGRVVRRLVRGRLAAGLHHQRWDGRDEAGRHLPGGLYFCRLDIGSASQVQRVLLAR